MGNLMNKIYILIFLAFIGFFSYGIIAKDNTNSLKKHKRLECQKKTITFEKIANLDNIEEAINLLLTDNYKIKSYIQYSKFMQTQIANYMDIKRANEYLIQSINIYSKEAKQNNKKLQIEYYIYENDKEDKGKKSKKAKLYAGYLVFEFKLENKLIYKIQTDYMEENTSDILQRMDCVIKSFISLEKGK